MTDLGRLLVLAGVGFVVVGALILLLDRIPGLPIGKLPGDFSWQHGRTRIYFPFATMVIVSIILTILVNVVLKLFR